MHNVYLYSGCYTLSPNADINWYTEKLGKRALLSEDDFVTYAADKKYSKNEKIACDLLYPAAKALDLGSAGNTIAPEEIGISFGTAQGCIHSLQHAAENIKQKGHKGMMPKDAANCILGGAASKVAIRLGIKNFCLTNYDAENAGLDAVLFASDMLQNDTCQYALACGGDEEGDAYGALLLGSQAGGTCLISGRAKGLVYGENLQQQMEFFTQQALTSCCKQSESLDAVILLSNTAQEVCGSAAKQICGSQAMQFTLSFPETAASSKGILAILYAEQLFRGEMVPARAVISNILLLQHDANGTFSCMILEKQ